MNHQAAAGKADTLSINALPVWLALLLVANGFQQAGADVLIGVGAPFTGQTFYTGEQVLHGVELAVADLNAGGGVSGERIQITIVDDACDPAQAVAAAEKLISEGVVLVVGHVCSSASIPASKIYGRAGIPMISPASTNPLLTEEGGPYIFRVVGRDDTQGGIAGNFLADRFGGKAIAILHDNQTYGKGLADETRKRLHARNITETLYQGFSTGEHDYSGLIDQLRRHSIEVMYIGGYVTEAALILRQAREQGLTLQLIAGDGLSSDEFWMIAGTAGNGALFTFPADPRNRPEAKAVVERFLAQGFEPEGFTLHAYAAVQIWAQAAEQVDSFAPDDVSGVLHASRFQTVLGEIAFDGRGDLQKPNFAWHVWQDGDYSLFEDQH